MFTLGVAGVTTMLPVVSPSTVSVNAATDPPAVALRLVDPAATAATKPLELTVATAVLPVVYVTGASDDGTGSPFASSGVTERRNVSPGNTPDTDALVVTVRLATMLGAEALVHPTEIMSPSKTNRRMQLYLAEDVQ